jgi:hypothetical protein
VFNICGGKTRGRMQYAPLHEAAKGRVAELQSAKMAAAWQRHMLQGSYKIRVRFKMLMRHCAITGWTYYKR